MTHGTAHILLTVPWFTKGVIYNLLVLNETNEVGS